jgi:LPS export ABC transporter protein LptC
VITFVIFISSNVYAQGKNTTESDQQINDFSLAGYGEKGKKSWDLAGKSADIFTDVVKLKEVIGNLYGKEEDIKLTADKGDFNKADGKVHLENNVVVTTTSGTRLTTDSLDWDRKNQLVTTKDIVNIQKDNMVVVASGAKGEPSLKKVALEKDIKLDINPVDAKGKNAGITEKIIITCDGPLEIDYEKNVATFNNNVKVDKQDSVIYSDKMNVFFITSNNEAKESQDDNKSDKKSTLAGNKIDRIVASGNVKVVRGDNISYSEEAIYSALDRKIILKGRPKLIIYSTEDFKNASTGD